jgi:hypothetical protein
MITVGFDGLSLSDQQTAFEKVDYTVYRIRNIFARASLGVGRVEHYGINAADSRGRDDLGSESEADDLASEWSVPNDGIDIFLVRSISDPDFVGLSPVPGECDKDDKDDGLVAGDIELRSEDRFSRTVAHEIGHFLHLRHNHGDDPPATTSGKNNLMAQSRWAISPRTSVELTDSQGDIVRTRCQVRNGC